jgi:hypothetical protein
MYGVYDVEQIYGFCGYYVVVQEQKINVPQGR